MDDNQKILKDGIKTILDEFSIVIALFIGIFEPGIMTLFLFKRDLFLQLDSMKLLLLACSFTIPSFLMGVLVSIPLISFKCRREHLFSSRDDRRCLIVSASFINFIIFNLCMILKIFNSSLTEFSLSKLIIILSVIGPMGIGVFLSFLFFRKKIYKAFLEVKGKFCNSVHLIITKISKVGIILASLYNRVKDSIIRIFNKLKTKRGLVLFDTLQKIVIIIFWSFLCVLALSIDLRDFLSRICPVMSDDFALRINMAVTTLCMASGVSVFVEENTWFCILRFSLIVASIISLSMIHNLVLMGHLIGIFGIIFSVIMEMYQLVESKQKKINT